MPRSHLTRTCNKTCNGIDWSINIFLKFLEALEHAILKVGSLWKEKNQKQKTKCIAQFTDF